MTNLMLPGFGEPELPDTLPALYDHAKTCTKCRLHQTRKQVTWGMGDPNSPLVVVGMGPSVSDDHSGGTYTGPAGAELDALFEEAGITRDDVWLTNAHKCVAHKKDDPYNIRQPTKTELQACEPWIKRELEIIKPKVMLVIGAPTAKWMIDPNFDLTTQRGIWYTRPDGIKTMATYQPTYITRLRSHNAPDAEEKYHAMRQDFIMVAKEAGLA